MLTFALRRFLILIPTLFVIVTASFFFVRLIPGGPFDQEKALPPEIEKNLRERYHLAGETQDSVIYGLLASDWRAR